MKRSVALGLLLLTMLSCAGGSETGNPAVPTLLGLQVLSSNPEAVAVSQGAGGTVIEEAWFSFGPFNFLPEGFCEDMEFDNRSGPTSVVADLAREGTQIELELDSGVYCGAIVALEPITSVFPNAAPEELSDHSVVVKGESPDGVPFILAYPERDELEILSVAGPFAVEASEDALLLVFDVSILMEGVALDTAELSPDGDIRIDAENNEQLLEAFEDNLECALELYGDADSDGMLGDDDMLLASCSEDSEDSED